jgi:hypothetical protein
MATVFKLGPMEQDMKDTGKIIKLMGGENFGMLTETFLKVSGQMIKQTDMEFMYI